MCDPGSKSSTARSTASQSERPNQPFSGQMSPSGPTAAQRAVFPRALLLKGEVEAGELRELRRLEGDRGSGGEEVRPYEPHFGCHIDLLSGRLAATMSVAAIARGKGFREGAGRSGPVFLYNLSAKPLSVFDESFCPRARREVPDMSMKVGYGFMICRARQTALRCAVGSQA